MEVREDLRYIKTHQWMKEEGGLTLIGITDYAQSQLGGIVFVNLPDVGDGLTAGEPFGEVESVKVVAEVHSPVSGTVAEVNEQAADEPETVNDDPYGTWLIKAANVTAAAELMTAEEYRLYLESLQA